MADAPSELRRKVRELAGSRCEYCGLYQAEHPYFQFHLEHVVARQHGGVTCESNLAWACAHCNLHKGTNLVGIDPVTGAVTTLFHPRRDLWADHFAFSGPVLVGKTAVGRTTIQLLKMNAPRRVELRAMSHQ